MLILIAGQYVLSSSDEFASFGAVFHNIYKQDSLVFQVCVLRYIQVEMAFLATVLYATTGWFMLLILKVFKWFSTQVLHKNTVINLFSSSFQVSRFKDNAYWTLNYWHWTVDLVLINIVQCGSFVLIFHELISHLYVLRPFASRTMLFLRGEECCEVFWKLFLRQIYLIFWV